MDSLCSVPESIRLFMSETSLLKKPRCFRPRKLNPLILQMGPLGPREVAQTGSEKGWDGDRGHMGRKGNTREWEQVGGQVPGPFLPSTPTTPPSPTPGPLLRKSYSWSNLRPSNCRTISLILDTPLSWSPYTEGSLSHHLSFAYPWKGPPRQGLTCHCSEQL